MNEKENYREWSEALFEQLNSPDYEIAIDEATARAAKLVIICHDLYQQHDRAVGLLRLAEKEIRELSNAIWDEYEGINGMKRTDNKLVRELNTFLRELGGGDDHSI